ncbi:hypothetical protein L6R50_21535 [Myxococcota bacterium]|nr:hypothetical protein [Myxococcota bacterium]
MAAAATFLAAAAGCVPAPCDLDDPTVLLGPGAVLVAYVDADGDRWGSQEVRVCDEDGNAEAPEGTVNRGGDCDDTDPANSPGLTEVCDGRDNDCDGVPEAEGADADGDGVRACDGDCDDQDPTTWPGAQEICDGVDNDCAGGPDPDEDDEDGDQVRRCDGDCDDSRAEAFPGAEELCNGRDDDCDGGPGPLEIDADGDGSLACQDCDDADPGNSHLGEESCDGLDNDCDGAVDEGLDRVTSYLDADGDGSGDPATAVSTCDGVPPGHVADGSDCDDGRPDVHPGAVETCDGVDQDCDGVPDDGLAVETWYADADGDGVGDAATARSGCGGAEPGEVSAAGDCDDADAGVHPGAEEVCDGRDGDCDGLTPESLLAVGEASFLYCPEGEGWEAARDACRALGDGWDLASVLSSAEQDALAAALAGLGAGDTWFGLNDAGTECAFEWSAGGSLGCPFATEPAGTCHLPEGAACDDFAWWEDGYPFDDGDAYDCGVLLAVSLTDATGDGVPEPYHWGVSGCGPPLPYVCRFLP